MPRKQSFSGSPATTESILGERSCTSTKLYNAALYCCRHRETGESLLHHSDVNLSLAKAFLDRCPPELLQDFLLQRNFESGYTPLHSAIYSGNLAAVLLLLRHAMQIANEENRQGFDPKKKRFVWRPMAALAGSTGSADGQDILRRMTKARDSEGFTPMQLLVQTQATGLAECRHALDVVIAGTHRASLPRWTFDRSERMPDEGEQLESTFSDPRRGIHETKAADSACAGYSACEVVTFGRAGHHALGVVQQSVSSSSTSSNCLPVSTQRVQEFAYERVGLGGSAVAVAAAAHHTLVVTHRGDLLSFGLSGKNGRLGLGDSIRECPLPRRVMGPLAKRKVMGVAAAENHSLCVTKDEGWVFAWGSNRFGQLGTGNTSSTDASAPTSNRWVPRRVEENVKHVSFVAVAAGERHSVALSRQGEVFVWGDNTAGQLGIAVSRAGSIQKPQAVSSLASKHVIRIAAAEQSTLVLALPVPGMPMNSVYQWGHGNHVPYKVSFEKNDSERLSLTSSRRGINPIEIACARYHNVAISSDGRVYTWGLHAEPLGCSNGNGNTNGKKSARARSSSFSRSMSSPQLVSGMLRENGGGMAVAVAASVEHTAVLTEAGTLYTWGASYGKHVLGHEGLRWQPSPKQVPGVHRAVKVALAREHTVLLVGASYVHLPDKSESAPASLELLAARRVAQHVDLFNVVPVLVVAERTECPFLVEYCTNFIKRNFDGVLNFAHKEVLGQYVDDMVSDSLHHAGVRFRDDRHHPFIMDLVTAGGSSSKATFHNDWLPGQDKWLQGCEALAGKSEVQQMLGLSASICKYYKDSTREGAESIGGNHGAGGRARSISNCSDTGSRTASAEICESRNRNSIDARIKKTTDIDFSSIRSAQESSVRVSREIRGVKKKLTQIGRLEGIAPETLSTEQQAKINRRPMLEAELCVYEDTLKNILTRIETMTTGVSENSNKTKPDIKGTPTSKVTKHPQHQASISEATEDKVNSSFSCEVCGVKCPDERSYALHNNGRKHRNKIAQVAEDEEKKVAKSIEESFQLKQIKSDTPQASSGPVLTKKTWNMEDSTLMYKLPSPPHPAMDQVESSAIRSKQRTAGYSSPPHATRTSLRDILEEQARKTDTTKSVRPTRSVAPTAVPSVWGSTPSRISGYSATDMPHAPVMEGGSTTPGKAERKSYSLADFLAPNKLPPTPQTSRVAPWASQNHACPLENSKSSTKKSLREIQEEEAEFVNKKQDGAYGIGGGSWFIERRERADSFAAIQEAAEKHREEQLFIEEQVQIEAQIKKEVELARVKRRSHKQNQKRRTPQKSTDTRKLSQNKCQTRTGRQKSRDKTPNTDNTKFDPTETSPKVRPNGAKCAGNKRNNKKRHRKEPALKAQVQPNV